ncbi:PUA-like domain-containing protein [Favolaschia claudopus]|uniref:PUA-like domain-containing protein n=1 Tax=Favolaschia claudopus TaxID=2862362 RepID=A0AAW0ECT7_9AGAR
MHPRQLRNSLHCPLCPTLSEPTTLPCGHAVCADHFPLSRCPWPQCAPVAGPSRPRIPPTSRVHYLPPPPAPPHPQTLHTPRQDVTLNKVIALLDRVLADNDSDDDYDDDEPLVRISDRPRKRPRLHNLDTGDDDEDGGDLLSHLRSVSRPIDPPLDLEKALLTELSCEICFMLLHNPVTTPCQHTFCSKCLHRALDHSNLCPLCRDTLPGFSFFEDHPSNLTLNTLLLTVFPAESTLRAESLAAEERDARLDTPIFVCMLIFPNNPTALHFFEPRYRLMLRRCLEQEVPSFGMIMPPRHSGGPALAQSQNQIDYGTMVEVRSVQMLPDGRSMVETWSTFRFRILERGTLDGYTVARIEPIFDIPDSPSSSPTLDGPSNEQLMDICTQFLQQLRRGTAPWVVQRLNNVYGAPPSDPAQFAYWVALILPIDEFEKAKLLPIRSARLRLRLVVHWIEQLNNNWWFTSGCVVF